MSFSLRFLNQPIPKDWLLDNERGYLIEVSINDFKENDVLLTGFWDKNDYLLQWLEGCNRLVAGSSGIKSAFTTAVHNPKHPEHGYVVQWWTAYKEEGNIYLRQESIVYNPDSQPVDLSRLYDYIPDRKSGEGVSEWKIPIKDIEKFKKEVLKLLQDK